MANIFISYCSKKLDTEIANQIYEGLKNKNEVFLALEKIHLGDEWAERIIHALEECEFFIVLLSVDSIKSDMVTEEVRRVKKRKEASIDNKPIIFPIRIKLPSCENFSYELAGYLNPIQQRYWNSKTDTHSILDEIQKIINKNDNKSTSTNNCQNRQTINIRRRLIGEYYKYRCNRKDHLKYFLDINRRLKDNRVKFYLIYGDEAQSHFGLSSRFHYELIGKIRSDPYVTNKNHFHGKLKKIKFECHYPEEDVKERLIRSLLSNFKIDDTRINSIDDVNISNLFRDSVELKGMDSNGIVTVFFPIYCHRWDDCIPNIFHWLINDFCSIDSSFFAMSPQFYFYVSLIYNDSIKKTNHKKMFKRLKKLSGIFTLPPLNEVKKQDIMDWLIDCEIGATTRERENFYNDYFNDAQLIYKMDEVEKIFEQIINKINNDYIESTD